MGKGADGRPVELCSSPLPACCTNPQPGRLILVSMRPCAAPRPGRRKCVESLKKIVSNQYFPAAAVLTAVVLFWTIAMFGGLSLLHNNQPPMATLTWMLFVYAAAVLTPLAGIIAA